MNADLLRRSTQLAEAGRLDEAETLLVEACDPAMLRFQLGSMSAVAAYRPRDQLLRLAVEDHEAERYHAVVPVVLAQIDGLVAEIIGAAPFHRTKDVLGKLVAWDSISAQTGGLPDLISLMASPRFETTTGPLDVPYRHGILHGRDLGYAHKKVAAKTWAALFSLREWALKYQHGEHEPPPVEPAPSVLATLRQIADAERQRKAIEAWRPRTGPRGLGEGCWADPRHAGGCPRNMARRLADSGVPADGVVHPSFDASTRPEYGCASRRDVRLPSGGGIPRHRNRGRRSRDDEGDR